MHDWTLLNLSFEWDQRMVVIALLPVQQGSRKQKAVIVGYDVEDLQMEARWKWGQSVSVNKMTTERAGELETMVIEMQSGDCIVIKAKRFEIPYSQFSVDHNRQRAPVRVG